MFSLGILAIVAVIAIVVVIAPKAVTANQLIDYSDESLRSIKVAASTHIYQGTAVFVDSDGYGNDDTATGANAFFGIAKKEADNSSGAAGAIEVECYREGVFLLTGAGTFTQADVGKDAFLDDNYALVVADGAASVRIGKVVRYASATTLWVQLDTVNYTQGAALTAQLTTITIADAAGTPDYALSALTTTSPYGLATAAEAISLLYVIQNLQVRLAQVEARLKAAGLVA